MTVTISSLSGYAGTASLTVSVPGLAGTVTIDPKQVTLNANGTATAKVTVTPRTTTASSNGHRTTLGGGGSGGSVALAALGGGGTLLVLLFGAGAVAQQAAYLGIRIAVLAVLVGLAGCGDGSSTTPGTVHSVQTYQGTISVADDQDATLGAQTGFKVTLKS